MQVALFTIAIVFSTCAYSNAVPVTTESVLEEEVNIVLLPPDLMEQTETAEDEKKIEVTQQLIDSNSKSAPRVWPYPPPIEILEGGLGDMIKSNNKHWPNTPPLGNSREDQILAFNLAIAMGDPVANGLLFKMVEKSENDVKNMHQI